MTKNLKSGLLLFLLVGPLLFYISFHLLGTNHYSIKKYYPISVNNNTNDTIYHQIPDFSFTNQLGEKVDKNTFEDKIYVANFFFTSCPTICPKMTNSMKYLQDSFKNHDDVIFLSHTVDPETDDVSTMKEYADLQEADHEKWNFVTGNKEDIYKIAKEGYKIIATENDGFVHSEKLVLVDKNFVIRGYFNGTNEKEVEDLLSNIRILMYEQPD